MTLADLIRHIGLEFGLDQNAASDEYNLMVDWANDAVLDVLLSTRCHLSFGDQTLTIGQGDYVQDATILAVDARTITANTFPVQLVTLEDIYAARRGVASSDYVMRLAFEGDLMMVWPTPSTAVTIRYVYVPKPTAMTSGSHDPSNTTYGGVPSWAHTALLSYMRWRAASYDERKVPHTPIDYSSFYQDELKKVRRRLRRIGGRSPLGMDAGYVGRTSAGTLNDRYPEN